MFKLLTITFVSTVLSQGGDFTYANFTKNQIRKINLAKKAAEQILSGSDYKYKDILINPDGGVCGYMNAFYHGHRTPFLKIVSL